MLVLGFAHVQHILFCHLSWVQVFELSQFSYFLVKMVNHCEVHVIFHDTEHQLEENILYHNLGFSFLQNLH